MDFQNPTYVKLSPVDATQGQQMVQALLLDGEEVAIAFRGSRDMVCFTSKRIIAMNVQGLTGKKTDFTSLPYSKVQAFAVETAGGFDRDCELELWFSGLGKARFEFAAKYDIVGLSKWLAHYIL
ncbi:MAG: PH domain-containing protein [Actinomycetota bacterium]|nr:PH domain-containing protein [Actinomycetota bacterium]